LYRVAVVRTNVLENISSSSSGFLTQWCNPIDLRKPEDGSNMFSETSVLTRATWYKDPDSAYKILCSFASHACYLSNFNNSVRMRSEKYISKHFIKSSNVVLPAKTNFKLHYSKKYGVSVKAHIVYIPLTLFKIICKISSKIKTYWNLTYFKNSFNFFCKFFCDS
jgi:hypothetical protein